MSRGPSRSEHLTDSEIEAIVLAAIPLRRAVQRCFISLKPFNETYSLLNDHVNSLDAVLEKITGRSIDYRGRDLGLLPAPTQEQCKG
ncbi:hypothetical protein IG197_23560 [Aminobacter sp. SR38]|jgi:hypothetical protein|uniref:hypothetical protein n=1 Tax=Aminobacter sp. SR38 TaxID=2774562 RepID=UPI00177A8F6E|nr:hypothetical protein [Aminobacter sp. SR38]QOF70740.1 hypothetical protein IG197_23560 [Aminobacter sp. SR38]